MQLSKLSKVKLESHFVMLENTCNSMDIISASTCDCGSFEIGEKVWLEIFLE